MKRDRFLFTLLFVVLLLATITTFGFIPCEGDVCTNPNPGWVSPTPSITPTPTAVPMYIIRVTPEIIVHPAVSPTPGIIVHPREP